MLSDRDIELATGEIKESFGDTVSLNKNPKRLNIFGRFDNLGTTRASIMQHLGSEVLEVMQSDNTITKIVSDDAAYTGQIRIEGHTILNGLLTYAAQVVTLNGQTPVDLPTPLARANVAYYFQTPQALAPGKRIYIHRPDTLVAGVPQTASKVHLLIEADHGRSQKCATALDDQNYWVIYKIYGGVLKKQDATADIAIQAGKIGEPVQTWGEFSCYTSGANLQEINLDVPLILEKNSDIWLEATSSVAGVEVIGAMLGYLAKKV